MSPQNDVQRTRPENIKVEEAFNSFVKAFGGDLVVDRLAPRAERGENADYVFDAAQVVAELKCLEKNLFACEEDVPRIERMIQSHSESGAVSGHRALRWVLGQEPTPRVYREDMVRHARRTIETAVRKADHQIRATKSALDAEHYRGLLLIVSDGNYFLEPREVLALLLPLMQSRAKRSPVDGFVYFTANMATSHPDRLREELFWVPCYRDDGVAEFAKFVNDLGRKWGRYYAEAIGGAGSNTGKRNIRDRRRLSLFRGTALGPVECYRVKENQE